MDWSRMGTEMHAPARRALTNVNFQVDNGANPPLNVKIRPGNLYSTPQGENNGAMHMPAPHTALPHEVNQQVVVHQSQQPLINEEVEQISDHEFMMLFQSPQSGYTSYAPPQYVCPERPPVEYKEIHHKLTFSDGFWFTLGILFAIGVFIMIIILTLMITGVSIIEIAPKILSLFSR